MTIYSFKDDYSEGAHANILAALNETNFFQEEGYGYDRYCNDAIQAIRKKINNFSADVHFVSGGTQANLISIAAMLKPYESIIAAITGHIADFEAGGIEHGGHKVHIVPSDDGKLRPRDIEPILNFHVDEHLVIPKAVYISNSTEVGTVYSKKELQELSAYCREKKLYLYLDGARLGSALMSEANDLSFPELADLLDMFYIGGTKNGALLGEAIVILNEQLKENFRFHIKQKGALLAKGRILGIQFLELFKDDLYFKLAKHANQMAAKLATALRNHGYKFLTEPVSNQIFPILPNGKIKELRKKYGFHDWTKIDDAHTCVRLVTSWATDGKYVDQLIVDF